MNIPMKLNLLLNGEAKGEPIAIGIDHIEAIVRLPTGCRIFTNRQWDVHQGNYWDVWQPYSQVLFEWLELVKVYIPKEPDPL